MVAAFGLVLALAWDGGLSRIDGAVLLLAYLLHAGDSYGRRSGEIPGGPASERVRRDAALAVGALALVLASASLLLWVIDGVVDTLELNGSMVGVLTIGLAAALPELSTVLEAVRRRTPTLAVGVLVGSNLVNLLVGLGLGSVISTYAIPAPVLLWDLPFKIVAAVALLVALRVRSGALTRRDGTTLVVAYFVYLSGRLLVFTTA
jgi:cation:H+ antiporter